MQPVFHVCTFTRIVWVYYVVFNLQNNYGWCEGATWPVGTQTCMRIHSVFWILSLVYWCSCPDQYVPPKTCVVHTLRLPACGSTLLVFVSLTWLHYQVPRLPGLTVWWHFLTQLKCNTVSSGEKFILHKKISLLIYWQERTVTQSLVLFHHQHAFTSLSACLTVPFLPVLLCCHVCFAFRCMFYCLKTV